MIAETQAEAPRVPRLALSKAEAADAIGCSVDFLEEHVLPTLRVVRLGRRVLIGTEELRKWIDKHSALTLGDSR